MVNSRGMRRGIPDKRKLQINYMFRCFSGRRFAPGCVGDEPEIFVAADTAEVWSELCLYHWKLSGRRREVTLAKLFEGAYLLGTLMALVGIGLRRYAEIGIVLVVDAI